MNPRWNHLGWKQKKTQSESVYDGTIQINYVDDTSENEVPPCHTSFVDTDAEAEFESAESEMLGSGQAESIDDSVFGPESSESNVECVQSDEADVQMAAGFGEPEWRTTEQEADEEITYELASEAEVDAPEWSDPPEAPAISSDYNAEEEVETEEDVEFSGPVPNPFTADADVSNLDDYPTVASIAMDPEMFESLPAAHPNDDLNSNSTVFETPSDPEMPFGLTMIGKTIPTPDTTNVFDAPFEMTMFGSKIPMPTDDFEPAADEPLTGFETRIVAPEETQIVNPSARSCAFCNFENDLQAIACNGCHAVLTLADLEMLLGNTNADKSVLRRAVEQMESERLTRPFTEAELTTLGIGHLNLRNLQFGYDFLHEASQVNPNNVVLAGQVNALLIRLGEIRMQDEVHDAMSKGKTILVVDDSPTVRKLIAGKLEKCGHDVFCSSDGIEAMERLEELRPDLILLDITMPRMDGYQVCKLIRSNIATKDVPVVMISGKDGFFDKVRGRMAGTSGYITKPFGPETLMKAVESHLRGEA